MTQPVTISVTATDIALGHPGLREQCPVARAIRRELGAQIVSVSCFAGKINGIRHSLPLPAQNIIWNYDRGLGMEPFSFDLVLA